MHAPERTTLISRFDGVDVLRGLSILAVILLHTFIRMKSAGFSVQQRLPDWLFYLLFRNGDNGVTVFFAISGFLITFTSLRRFGSLSEMRPTEFYRIRFARIAPLLLLILAILSILHLTRTEGFQIPAQKATLARALFAALTFHLNWLEAVRGYLPANWDVLWSLSVEEMFYLFFPIICVLLFQFQRGKTLLVALLLIFVAMGPFARAVWTTNQIWEEKSYLGGMDGIALGCLTALLTDRLLLRCNRPRQHWLARLVILEILGAAMMFLIALWPQWLPWVSVIGRTGLDGTLLALGTCLVIISTVLLRNPRKTAPESRVPPEELKGSFPIWWHAAVPFALLKTIGSRLTAPIRWFGRHSYEVYLTHEFVVVWGTQLYTKLQVGSLAIWVIAILVFCAPLGAVVAKYFSEPLNRILRRSRAATISTEPDRVNA